MATLKQIIDEANMLAIHRLTTAALELEDVQPAHEVISFFKEHPRAVLHAGPPRPWASMCNAMKGAIVGMVLLEGWAKTPEEAFCLMDSGQVKTAANNEHCSVGPMSGIITPSLPVFVVHNKTFGNRSFSRPADLHQQFGNFQKIDAVRAWRDVVAPALRSGLKALGPLNLMPLLQGALDMGDDLHNRVTALTTLLVNELTFGMIKAGIAQKALLDTLQFVFHDPNGPRLTLGLAMACAQAILNPACNIEFCTLVTCMARNGVDWGIRVSSLGSAWFTAPAPTCHKYYIFPPYARDDFGNDMGDSVITETAGWGGLIMANSMALAYIVGASPDEAFEISRENQKLTTTESPLFKVPAFGYRGAPLGIDIRKVSALRQVPVINTGIAHKDHGHSVVARGLLKPPLLCFEEAAASFCKRHNCTMEALLATL